ncbi:MAG: lipopolysaccharide biosynthesis protein [Devosiaceae bacterium]|nr:lipopolysaccharide biosynthesis protein [Devosiaceae bacterium]
MLNFAILWNYFHRFLGVMAGRVGGALAIFLVNILIARNLGAEALGTYAVFVALVAILALCISIGYNSTASVFAAEYKTTGKKSLLKGYVQTSLKYSFFSSGFLLIALVITWVLAPQFLADKKLVFAFLVIITALGAAILNLNSAISVGLGRQVTGLLPETLVRPLLIGVALFLIINRLPDIYWVMGLSAFSTWLALIIAYFGAARPISDFKKISSQFDLSRWKKASRPWLATSLLWDYMIDLVLILTSLLAGAVEIAILHVSFRYRVLAGFGMRTIYLLLMPEISKSTIDGDKQKLHQKIAQANWASLIYSLATILLFAIFGNWLLALFSNEFTSGLPVLIIISLTMLIRAIFGPAALVLAVNNLHLATATISLFGLLITVTIIIVFFAQFSLLAVAIAYSASNLMVSIMLWIHAKNKTGIDCSIFASRPTAKLIA